MEVFDAKKKLFLGTQEIDKKEAKLIYKLRFLFRFNLEGVMSISSIQKHTIIPYTTLYRLLDKLEEKDLITINEVGQELILLENKDQRVKKTVSLNLEQYQRIQAIENTRPEPIMGIQPNKLKSFVLKVADMIPDELINIPEKLSYFAFNLSFNKSYYYKSIVTGEKILVTPDF